MTTIGDPAILKRDGDNVAQNEKSSCTYSKTLSIIT